ncbi:hypothetical protein Val02_69060 [Virgisporangium aliadipatigenens]|uniref:Immunity protein Imm1 n=1 Tax=Virgisporangium aliadipatigenens TaxID=741659 RepID=A0A8J4DT92_9ACTN|nr:Imm1 family immunity protein [Virgisporangium aliadipatigenens]GIJ50020.1 hypothetical protein Val02_69060 [Virgisporangium aliadipatigenens]
MSAYRVGWGEWDEHSQATVSTVDDLDTVLDRVAASRDEDGYGYKAGIFADGATFGPFPVGIEITLGHPDRASVLYTGPEGVGIGYDPALPPWENGPLWFNYNGVPTDYVADRLRLTPTQARDAVREFVQTGKRPTNIEWDDDEE